MNGEVPGDRGGRASPIRASTPERLYGENMLAKKVDTLTRAMEIEAKKMRRDVAAMEKEVASMRVEKDHENKAKRVGSSKGPVSSKLLPGRTVAPRTGMTRSTQ